MKCRNWDGGYQEFSTARDAVLAVFPQATIIENRVDEYPIKVEIKAQVKSGLINVWSGRQQNLFRKYADKRQSSISEIQANLEDLKEEFNL